MKKIIITGGLGYIGTELCKIYSGTSWNDEITVIDNRFISERVNQLRKWNINFVHGDINPSNVLYNGKQFNLIDLEPSFRQKKFGKKIVTSAVPLRSLNDIKNKSISVETDKIGFYLFGMRLLGKALKFPNKRELSKQRKRGMEFLPIQERLFLQLSFKEIFEKFIKPSQGYC